jgi:hypothetical protein
MVENRVTCLLALSGSPARSLALRLLRRRRRLAVAVVVDARVESVSDQQVAYEWASRDGYLL